MEELDISECPTASPIVRIVPMKSGHSKKPSIFSILHKEGKHPNATQQLHQQIIQNTCRICLERQGQQTMLRPCKCIGTVEYAHESCLREQIQRKIEVSEMKVRCELCQTQYNYDAKQNKMFQCSQLASSCQNKPKQMCCYLFLLFIAVLLFAGVISFLVIIDKDNNLKAKFMPTQATIFAYFAAIIFSLFFLVLVSTLFVGEFFMKKIIYVRVRSCFLTQERLSGSSRNSTIRV